MRPAKHGVVVVVEREGRFLVIRRAATVIAPHAWCFVGGAIEAGESEADAVVREFREEVGGHVRPLHREWEHVSDDGRLHLAWWRAELIDGELCANPHEVAEFRWCAPHEIACLPDLLPSNREYLTTVLGLEPPSTRLGDANGLPAT